MSATIQQQQLNQQTFSNTTKAIKRVAIYARVSTTEQAEEGYSIDEQQRLLTEWCERNGYIVHEVYADRGISGKSVKKTSGISETFRGC